ncbi:7TM-DISM domain-containing protein [Algoriphagus sanaruensis]|uniref:histidine kinase n=1 Tax=Algoriphagus sanaruensis TaxID=1727163 RepID=A0A142EP68_9BACT|nr:7TM-DISM domain-containing protein [Algoriphagus sanaruensis]AMQ56923.1 hypothetical protein AO498_10820 [Algoriphagus sanaruensis]
MNFKVSFTFLAIGKSRLRNETSFWKIIAFTFLILSLFSCNSKEGNGVKFGVFADEGQSIDMAWNQFDTLSKDIKLFNPGITRQAWWLGITLHNPSNQKQQLFFVPNNPHINQIQVFEKDSSQPILELGDIYPFEQRPFLDRDLVIPFELAPGSTQDYLIRLDKAGETFHIEPELFDFESFQQRKAKDTLVIGWILGWLSIIFLFAIFFALELKAWSGAIYAAYVLSISFWLATHWGLTFQYLWPTEIIWVAAARPFFNLLTNVLILLLVVRFFPPVIAGKWTAKFIWGNLIFQAALIFLVVFTPKLLELITLKIILLQVTGLVSVATSLLVLIYSFQQWRAKVPLAGHYLLGISFLVLFGMTLQLNQKLIPMGLPHYLVDFGSAFGLMGETAIITAAFARRASLFKKEKEKLAVQILEKEKQVADQLIQVQEDERQRLGRDLHDSIGGMLASLYLKTETLNGQYPTQELEELRILIDKSIQEARSLSHNLTPHHLEENGLENVLQLQLDLIQKKHHIQTNFYFQIHSPISKSLQLVLYRISSELLLNMVKHSEATEALLSISEQDGKIELIAEDNGKGMNPTAKKSGIGLKNIQERVGYFKGNLHLESDATGTTITINFPVYA